MLVLVNYKILIFSSKVVNYWNKVDFFFLDLKNNGGSWTSPSPPQIRHWVDVEEFLCRLVTSTSTTVARWRSRTNKMMVNRQNGLDDSDLWSASADRIWSWWWAATSSKSGRCWCCSFPSSCSSQSSNSASKMPLTALHVLMWSLRWSACRRFVATTCSGCTVNLMEDLHLHSLWEDLSDSTCFPTRYYSLSSFVHCFSVFHLFTFTLSLVYIYTFTCLHLHFHLFTFTLSLVYIYTFNLLVMTNDDLIAVDLNIAEENRYERYIL